MLRLCRIRLWPLLALLLFLVCAPRWLSVHGESSTGLSDTGDGATGGTIGDTPADTAVPNAESSSGLFEGSTGAELASSGGVGTAGAESTGAGEPTGTTGDDQSTGSTPIPAQSSTGASLADSSSGMIDLSTGDFFGVSSSGGVDSGSSGASDGVADSSTGDQTPDEASSGTSEGGETGPTAPVVPKGAPWFMSYRGSDTLPDDSLCGQSVTSPCLTFSVTYGNLVSLTPEDTPIEDATILIEVQPEGTPYACEAPEGAYVYTSLTIAPYSVSPTDPTAFTIHGSGIDQTTIERVAEYTRRYEAEMGTGSLAPGFSSPLPVLSPSSPPAFDSSTSVTFDCVHEGRLFYAYSYIEPPYYVAPTILRMVNIRVVNGSATPSSTGLGASVLVVDAGIIAENCTFEGAHTDLTLPDYYGASIAALSSTVMLLDSCTFLNNSGQIGGALHVTSDGTTVVPAPSTSSASALQSWLWLDRCRFDGNTATQLGGAIRIGSSTYERVDRFRVDITRTSFDSNQIIPGPFAATKLRAEGGAMAINLNHAHTFTLVIDGCTFNENVVAPLESVYTQANGHRHGGGAFISAEDHLADSSIHIIGSTFLSNRAGVGGGVIVELTSQVGSTVRVVGNRFENNTASTFGHMAQGGGLAINPGPRIDKATCDGQAVPCTLSQTTNTYTIDTNTFSNNFAEGVGGALLMYYHSDFRTRNESINNWNSIIFDFPESTTDLPAGVTLQPDALTLSRNRFVSNAVAPPNEDGQAGVGGAIAINLQPDLAKPVVYDYALEVGAFKQFEYATRVEMSESTFVNSSASCGACYGGAIYLKHGDHRIHNHSFTQSYAGSFGGSIFMDVDSTTVHITSSTFDTSRSNQRGQVVHSLSGGGITFDATNIYFDTSADYTQLDSAVGGQMAFINLTRIECTSGFSLRNHSIYSYRSSTTRGFLDQLVSSRAYSCEPCQPNTYSLASGFSIDDGSAHNEVSCLECPFGATCQGGQNLVKAREGNWAAVRNSTTTTTDNTLRSLTATNNAITIVRHDISFYSCPTGYCCPFDSSCPIGYCANNREGILCSQCRSGYSMVLLSSACRPTSDCNDGGWFWPVVFFGSLIFSLLLFFSPKSPATISTNKDERRRPPSFSAVAKILLYFGQMIASILTPASQSSLRYVGMWIATVCNLQLNFDVNEGSRDSEYLNGASTVSAVYAETKGRVDRSGVCVDPNMTGLDKIGYGFVFPCIAALWLLVSYLIFRAIAKRQSRAYLWLAQHAEKTVLAQSKAQASESQDAAQKRADLEVESDGASVQLPTANREADSATAGIDLKDTESFAAHDGNKAECVASDGGVHGASSTCLAHSNPLSCVFSAAGVELFLLSYSAILRSTMSLLQCVDVEGTSRLYLSADMECYTGLQVFMLIVLIGLSAMPIAVFFLGNFVKCSYSLRVVQSRYTVAYKWYESILMLRRYVFVLFLIFILDPFVQSYLLLLVLIASLAFHQSTRPFCSAACNHLETLCLFCLTAIAAINVRSATLASAQIDQPTQTRTTTTSLDALTMCLILMPAILCILFFASNQLRLRRERIIAEGRITAAMAKRQIELEDKIQTDSNETNAQL